MKRRFSVLLWTARYPAHWMGRDVLQQALMSAAKDLGFLPLPEMPNAPREDDVRLALQRQAVPRVSLPGTDLVYNLEPMPMPTFYGHYASAIKPVRTYAALRRCLKKHGGQADAILDYGEGSTRFLLEMGHRAVFCPPGYHEAIEIRDAEPLEKGVYFLGRPEPELERGQKHRKTVLDEVGGDMRYVMARKDPSLRDRLLVTPGVHLNIRRLRWVTSFGGMKMIQMLLCNGRFVISEPHWWSPIDTGAHFVEADAREIPSLARYYLERDAERQEIARRGYEFVKKSLHMTPWLRRALELLRLI